MGTIYADPDFEKFSWHDCRIWGLEFRTGDVNEDDWTTDLVLDIDFIVEWVCDREGGAQFRVAPATLVFHGVSDLKVNIDWGNSGFQLALHEVSIDRINRERISDQKVFLDRPYYKWSIRLNWPQDGEIAFGAVGFSQTLRSEPVLMNTQSFSLRQRKEHVR
jgi:hypothetical protein